MNGQHSSNPYDQGYYGQQQQQQHYQQQQYNPFGQAAPNAPPPAQHYQQRQQQQQGHQQHYVAPGWGGGQPFTAPAPVQQQQQQYHYQAPSAPSAPSSSYGSSPYGSSQASAAKNPYASHGTMSERPPSIDLGQADNDVLNEFDPLSGKSVLPRCDALYKRGLITEYEKVSLVSHHVMNPTAVENALVKLERNFDRSGVTEVMVAIGSSRVPAPNANANMGGSFPSKRSEHVTFHMHSNTGSSRQLDEEYVVDDADDSSSENDSTTPDTLVDSDDEEDGVEGAGGSAEDLALAKMLQAEFDKEASALEAPHPKAGGFKEPMPSNFVLVNGELMGHVLIRVSSKKLFRKWKEMFFVLNRNRLCMYQSNADYESGRPPRIVYRMHPCMYIRKPALKQTYSIMDDGRRIYYTTFRENETEEGSSRSYTGRPSTQTTYSFDSKSERICKFGANHLTEVSAFAHALHGVILWKRREKVTKLHEGGSSDVSGRYQ